MRKPKVYVDFNNADPQGRLRLNCHGTDQDLARQRVKLREGLPLMLYSDDVDDQGQSDELLVEGIVTYSADEGCWVAIIDYEAIRHASEERKQKLSGRKVDARTSSTGRILAKKETA